MKVPFRYFLDFLSSRFNIPSDKTKGFIRVLFAVLGRLFPVMVILRYSTLSTSTCWYYL